MAAKSFFCVEELHREVVCVKQSCGVAMYCRMGNKIVSHDVLVQKHCDPPKLDKEPEVTPVGLGTPFELNDCVVCAAT